MGLERKLCCFCGTQNRDIKVIRTLDPNLSGDHRLHQTVHSQGEDFPRSAAADCRSADISNNCVSPSPLDTNPRHLHTGPSSSPVRRSGGETTSHPPEQPQFLFKQSKFGEVMMQQELPSNMGRQVKSYSHAGRWLAYQCALGS